MGPGEVLTLRLELAAQITWGFLGLRRPLPWVHLPEDEPCSARPKEVGAGGAARGSDVAGA